MDTPETQSKLIAGAVSAALKSAGISQREAATLTGIPLTTLSRRLTGLSPLNVAELAALAELSGVSVVDVVRSAETTQGGAAA